MQFKLFKSRDDVLDNFEITRTEYLAKARAVADQLGANGARITINDVRERCPVPDGIDPRVLGAVLRPPAWKAVGFTQSERRECHGRPIRLFEKKIETGEK